MSRFHELLHHPLATTVLTSALLACLPNAAGAADFGSLLKGLGSAIQRKAEEQRAPTDTLAPSAETQKERMASEERVRNSLKATKTPPSSAAWTKLYNQRQLTFYYDPALIRQNGLYVTIPYMVDLPVANELNLLTDGRFPYKSVISVLQFDCSRRSLPPRSERFWATEDHFYFPENMAQGDPMMHPARAKDLQWIEGMENRGMTYEGGSSGNVNQSFFVFKVLDAELKICSNYWKRPEGFEPPKTPPYVQKKPLPPCQGADMWKWQDCVANINRGRPNPHPGTDLVFKLPGRYTGPVTMGSPNGWGTFVFEGGDLAGDMYVGFFYTGNFSGFGTYYHNAPNKLKGSVFVGFFKDQLKDGPGVYAFADGTPTQEGRWEKGRLDKPSKTFLMETMKGLPFCQGSDATQWTECFGFLEFESIQGQALQKRDGTSYAGGFRNGLPDGVGSFFDKNRYLDYQGELKGGKHEGVGTEFLDVAGYSFYSGGFLDNKRHGKGVFQSGGALNDERRGRLMERYEGDYVNGTRTGQGTLYREMDFTYVGGFKNNLFDGEGTYTPERKPGGGEPVVQQGMWEKGKLLKPGQSPAEAGRKKK